MKLLRPDLARQSLRTNWGGLGSSGVEGIGECQAEPGGLHSQAEPGNEKRTPLPWFPGSAWEPMSSGHRPETRSEGNFFEGALVSGIGSSFAQESELSE